MLATTGKLWQAALFLSMMSRKGHTTCHATVTFKPDSDLSRSLCHRFIDYRVILNLLSDQNIATESTYKRIYWRARCLFLQARLLYTQCFSPFCRGISHIQRLSLSLEYAANAFALVREEWHISGVKQKNSDVFTLSARDEARNKHADMGSSAKIRGLEIFCLLSCPS